MKSKYVLMLAFGIVCLAGLFLINIEKQEAKVLLSCPSQFIQSPIYYGNDLVGIQDNINRKTRQSNFIDELIYKRCK